MHDLLHLKNKKNIISGVKLQKYKVNRDKRGMLVEVFKPTWKNVLNNKSPFGQSYYSITKPGFARDENRWHFHPNQTDRFTIIKGNVVFALYDLRKNSKTNGVLNLFLMGEKKGDENQFLLSIPPNVLHSFCVMGDEECILLSFPTHIYNLSEELRIPFSEVKVLLPNGEPFSWYAIRSHYNKYFNNSSLFPKF